MQKHIKPFLSGKYNENVDFTLAGMDISINIYAMISKISQHITRNLVYGMN